MVVVEICKHTAVVVTEMMEVEIYKHTEEAVMGMVEVEICISKEEVVETCTHKVMEEPYKGVEGSALDALGLMEA